MIERVTKRAESSGRTDDNMESLKKRFKTFEGETLPVIDYFRKKGKVIEVRISSMNDYNNFSQRLMVIEKLTLSVWILKLN